MNRATSGHSCSLIIQSTSHALSISDLLSSLSAWTFLVWTIFTDIAPRTGQQWSVIETHFGWLDEWFIELHGELRMADSMGSNVTFSRVPNGVFQDVMAIAWQEHVYHLAWISNPQTDGLSDRYMHNIDGLG